MITRTFSPIIIQTDPSGNVRAVRWKLTYTDGTYESIAEGKTILTGDFLASSNPNIEELVIAEMGQPVLDGIDSMHEFAIKEQSLESTLTDYYVSPDYVCDTTVDKPVVV